MSERQRGVMPCKHAVQIISHMHLTHAYWRERSRRADQWIFRGQADARWNLIPSSLRVNKRICFRGETFVSEGKIADSRQQQAEFYTLQEFRELADKVGLALPGDN